MRGGQGETSAGGKRSVNRGGGGNTGSSYHPPADGQNLLGKDSTFPNAGQFGIGLISLLYSMYK